MTKIDYKKVKCPKSYFRVKENKGLDMSLVFITKPDPINAPQIFVKLTESKAKELAELFERTNEKNDGLRITIEIFKMSDENA
jgi:hypothetical protein